MRNIPMTQAQQRNYMMNYIKHMGSHTLQQLKRYSFNELKELFETTMKNVNTLVPMETEDRGRASELAVKYPIIDWEVYSEDTRRYWKIIRDLVKERFSTTEPTNDKEKELWVELKRLFEPDSDDTLWKLQRYIHDPLVWRLYDTCGVHHVSSIRGHDIFMLIEKDYPLSKGVQMLMLDNKLLVEQHSEMGNELLRKIFIQANIPR
ncbi:hypothetical protein Tco_0434296 [Tanacetum coccineum]